MEWTCLAVYEKIDREKTFKKKSKNYSYSDADEEEREEASGLRVANEIHFSPFSCSMPVAYLHNWPSNAHQTRTH